MFLDNLDFFLGQAIKLIHQAVNLGVGGFDLSLDHRPLRLRFGLRQLLVQREHVFHQRDHAVVPGFVGGVFEVDGADGKGPGFIQHYFWKII